MEWQPIDGKTPANMHLELGRYRMRCSGENGPVWETEYGVPVKEMVSMFGRVKRKVTWVGERYSHWRLPPAPPND